MIQRSACLSRTLLQSSTIHSSISKVITAARYIASEAGASLKDYEPFTISENDDVDWNNLGFKLMPADYMYIMKCSSEAGSFTKGQLTPYGNVELSPSAGVLNYGQGLFEGTKAYRGEGGRLCLFRPEQNGIRMQIGAERMCMPSPSIAQFVDAVKLTAVGFHLQEL